MKNKLTLLLIYPDFLEEDKYNRNKLGNYSEGLASISAVVKQAGYDVKLYHQLYMPSRKEFISAVKGFDADIIGFSARTTAMPFITEMAQWLDEDRRATGGNTLAPPVVIGGYHAVLVPDECIKLKGIDMVIVGEGEYPFVELLDSMRDNAPRTDIESIYFKQENGEVIKNPVAPLIEDLDSLPFPDFELFDYANLDRSKNFTAMVMLSRGCLFSCTYCGNSQFRNIYPNKNKFTRFRSPKKAIELLELLLEKYPFIKYFEFRDAIFNMYREWFFEFMPMYIEKIRLPFNCNLRFDILDEEMVRLLKDGGCYMIDIGLENGNEEFRKKYLHRAMKNEHMILVAEWFRKYKITTLTYNIVGLPYETLELSLETVKLNARLSVDKVIPNIFYPYPMTILEKTARDAGFIDPAVDPNDPVQLRMPQYPKYDILYMAFNFNKLVKKYRAIFALPAEKADKKEAKLDKKITSKYYPRKFLYRTAKLNEDIFIKLKRFIKKISPKLFIFLKNRTMKDIKEVKN
ncbi:MAG: B12-binding domain-containing radical SAM protein [Oscillospiraceae bacterium]|nr:B12-binding domain-containing radical SAM protein [Oscillospiraceae bacterium]